MRKLKLLLVLCMVAIAASASKTVYLSPGVWATDDARFALNMFTDGVGAAWVDFTDADGDGIFTATCDDSYAKMIICRMDKTNTTNAWNADGGTVWNQTQDITIPTIENLTYVISGWDNDNGKSGYNIAAYVYNADNDLFFSRGNDWGTQAVAAPVGLPWKLEQNDGKYTLKMYDIYTQNSNDTGLGYAGAFTDSGSPLAFTPEGDATNGYTLKNGDNFINCPATAGVVEFNTTSSKWKFLTQAQYNAVLADRATAQEADIAAKKGVTIPAGKTFSEFVGDVNQWAASTPVNDGVPTSANWATSKHNDRGGNLNWGDYGSEMYQCGDGHYTRTITGLKEGVYKLSVRAMKRVGNNANGYAMGQAGFSVSDSYVNANGYIIPIKAWSDDCVSDGNPNSPADFVNIVNNGGYTAEGFVYVGSDGKLEMDVTSEAFWWGSWFLFNGISYTYFNNEVDAAAATAIIDQAEALEAKPMLAATKTALTQAKTAFNGSKTIANYNALTQAVTAAQASADIYAPLGTALADANTVKATCVANGATYTSTFETNISAINTDYTNGAIAEADIPAKVKDVEAEVVLLVKSQTAAGSDMTLAVPNAAGTAAVGADNWQLENALASGEKFQLDTWAGTASGMSVPMIEYWISNGNTLSSNVIYQTISGLQEGVYTVTATTAVNNESSVAPNAGSALLFANDATTDITSGATETSFKGQTGTFTVQVALNAADGGNLKIGFKTVSPNYNWIAFKDVKLTFDGALATAAQKQALADAITAAEGNTLGFEAGEYAPYNNVAALAALTAAKAVDPAVSSAADVVAATTALTSATWTANTEEVNAIFDGSFSSTYSHDGNVMPIGWHGVGDKDNATNVRLMWNYESNPGLNATSSKQAAFAKFTALYGTEAGYTMPLKAGTYKLDFIYGGWNEQGTRDIKVYSGDTQATVTPLTVTAKNNQGHTTAESWSTYNGIITIPADGDYVLSFYRENTTSQNQLVFSDIVLKKTTPVYAVVGSKKGDDSDKAIFSSGWDQETQTDILTESSGVYTKTYSAQELDAQTIAYKVIMKNAVEAKTAAAWYPNDNQEVVIPRKGGYDIIFTFTPGNDPVVAATATKVSEPVTIGEKRWATTVTNSALDFSASGVEAYTAKVENSSVVLTKVNDVQAETGLVLKGTAGTYYIPVIASSTTDKGSLLHSSTDSYWTWHNNGGENNKFYGLSVNAANEAQFVQINCSAGNEVEIPAGKAFLLINSSSAARTLSVIFADETTGINTVSIEKDVDGIYNLNGQRVDAPVRGGLYIVNGKKVVLK